MKLCPKHQIILLLQSKTLLDHYSYLDRLLSMEYRSTFSILIKSCICYPCKLIFVSNELFFNKFSTANFRTRFYQETTSRFVPMFSGLRYDGFNQFPICCWVNLWHVKKIRLELYIAF